ncbi:ferredoxin--NADP reductase, embryo isozyme, chloroplastic-like [Humulus lupulus]|uniref:ferredoxin--NADP reductase, embryo isozyme, chloroplastic-like n=1 Tax=Humulus lupulus TaxID=3486 RepID=UPI002B40A8DE|nr:ferredoxin--NADP reductase, embryo isozyme, chloroplastic-like [Humulus lupulus]
MAPILSNTSDVRRVPVAPLELENAIRPPTNLYTHGNPCPATFLSVRKINSGHVIDKTVYEIVFDHHGDLSYWEGQAFMVICHNPDDPNVLEPKTVFAASSRYGDYFNGKTATIIVPLDKNDKTLKYLCMKARRRDHLQLVGPSFEATLLGDYSPTATHIFVAKSGAAIAPFRAHLRHFFKEDIPLFKFAGQVLLFYGVEDDLDSRVYNDEFKQYEQDYPRNFNYKYFNDILQRQGESFYVFQLVVHSGAYIYLVGPQSMVDEVEAVFRSIANQNTWDGIKDDLIKKNQWRVQVYDY